MEKIHLGQVDDATTQVLIGSLPKFWTEHDGKPVLFKHNMQNWCGEFRTDFGEVLYSRVCQQIGVPCVNCNFASYNKNGHQINGVIVDSFYQNRYEFSVHYAAMVVEICKAFCFVSEANAKSVCEISKKYAKLHNYKINSRKVGLQARQQCIVDYFLSQEDRSTMNIEFIANTDTLRLAPIFDNGFCMCFCNTKEENDYVLQSIANNPAYNYNVGQKFLMQYFDDSVKLAGRSNNLTKQIIQAMDANYQIKKLVYKILDIDMKSLIEALESESGDHLDKTQKRVTLAVFDRKKQIFEEKLQEFS